MKATIKCSECGSEITNLNMSWGNKHLLVTLLILPLAFLPMLFIFKDRFADKPDFRQELSITITKVAYGQGELTMHGTIENLGGHRKGAAYIFCVVIRTQLAEASWVLKSVGVLKRGY